MQYRYTSNMAFAFFALFILYSCEALSVSFADNNNDNKWLIAIEDIKEIFQHETVEMKERLNEQERIITALQLNSQNKDIEYRKNIKALEERLRDIERKSEARNPENARHKMKSKYNEHNFIKDLKERSLTRRAAIGDEDVAFTAYLDHNINNIKPLQIIEFNHVLLNHGNAYNSHTSVFTVPVTGVYSFTFFIGQRGVSNAEGASSETHATLKVNDYDQVSAAVETSHAAQDSQGGNTANLLLNKGDTVSVIHSGGGPHVEGYARTTTFSGFLLFPVETQAVIG